MSINSNNNWLSVAADLPTPGVLVIINYINFSGENKVHIGRYNGNDDWFFIDHKSMVKEVFEVTHWKPCPCPFEALIYIGKGGISVTSVDDLLILAKSEPDPKTYVALWEYGEVIHILYSQKNLTYKGVADWFRERGLDYSTASFSSAYKEWRLVEAEKVAKEMREQK